MIIMRTVTDDTGARKASLLYDERAFASNSRVEDAARKLLGWHHRRDHIVKMVARPVRNGIIFDLHFCCRCDFLPQYVSLL